MILPRLKSRPDSPPSPYLLPTVGLLTVLGIGLAFCAAAALSVGSLEPHKVEDALATRKPAIQVANALRYRLLRTAPDAVVLGSGGWLYLSQELRPIPGWQGHLERRAEAVAALEGALRARGTQLVVAVVPAKARIHPESLPGLGLPEQLQGGLEAFLSRLEARGVPAVRLTQPLSAAATQAPVFYKTDTHWNQSGAEVGAQALARTVLALGLSLPEAQFRSRPAGPPAERVGDLINLMGLADLPAGWRPEGDLEAPLQVETVSAANQGLLGGSEPEVVLVGTSYSLRGNFQGFLQEALRSPVLNLAQEGSGFAGSMSRFLPQLASLSPAPKVVVWEFSERFLYLPLEEHLPSLAQP